MSTSLIKNGIRISTIEHLMAAFSGLGIDNAFVEMAKSAIKRESSNSSNLFQLPASIGGAGGAIKLKPGDLNSDTKTGGGGAGGKKKKGCC
jgi:hypothetical protein